jgi:peptide/nickel transport system permease protein
MRAVRQGGAARWGLKVVRQLVGAALAMLGVIALVFLVSHILGDPTRLILGPRATSEQIALLQQQLGYDDDLATQFVRYLGRLLHGDLGVSQYTQQPVAQEIWRRFPATLELSAAALLLGLLWTVPLGVLSAFRPRGIVDRISQAIVEFGVAVPSFWLGILLILLFYSVWPIAPSPVGELDIGELAPPHATGITVVDSVLAGQFDTLGSALKHLALPAITLSVSSCPPILQLTRNAMRQALRSDFIRSARSLGLPERTIRWYALKSALLPVITMTAMTFGYLLGGTVLVETVFSWPGIGLYAVQGMQQFDYEPVLGVVIVAAAVYILVYLLADLISHAIDPRVRGAD